VPASAAPVAAPEPSSTKLINLAEQQKPAASSI
jgi:hypothetical protein